MHWIIQTNLFSEDGWQTLVETLERFNIPHSIHQVVPFAGDILPDASPEGPVICMGAYSLRHIAKRKGWYPGVFDLEPFDFTEQLKHWGNHMLNSDAVVSRFEDAQLHSRSFVRPTLDSKSFSGAMFGVEEFYEWKRKICVLGEDYGTTIDKNTMIQVCPYKHIYAEYRYWIVKGEIVTKSMYKRGDKVFYTSDVDPMYDDFVKARIAEWQPLDAFVIDVCSISPANDDEQGSFHPRIVEINTLNSSGYYAGDVQRLVLALEDAFGV